MTRDMKPRILFASSHENRAEKNSAIQALRLMAEFKTLLKPVSGNRYYVFCFINIFIRDQFLQELLAVGYFSS